MGTTSDKLIYLNDTKVGIADAIETNNVIVHDEDTFRSYVEKIVSIKPTFVYDAIERISQKGARFEAIDCLDYSVKNNMYGNPSFVLKPHIYSSGGLYPIIPENRIGQEEILNGDFEQEGQDLVVEGDFENSLGKRTNLIPNSIDFIAGWNYQSMSIFSNDETSPDGSLTGTRINTTNGNASVYNNINVLSNQTYTFSFYAKIPTTGALSNPRIAIYDNTNTEFIEVEVFYLPITEWKRFSITFTTSSNTTSIRCYPVRNVLQIGDLFLWGAQLNKGDLQPYVKTTGQPRTVLPNGEDEVLGADLITNGDFENGSTGWDFTGDTIVENGALRIKSDDGSVSTASPSGLNIVEGKYYKLTYDSLSSNSGAVKILTSSKTIFNNIDLPIGNGKELIFKAPQSSPLYFARQSGVTDCILDNITLSETNENSWSYTDNFKFREGEVIIDSGSYRDGFKQDLILDNTKFNKVSINVIEGSLRFNIGQGFVDYVEPITIQPDSSYDGVLEIQSTSVVTRIGKIEVNEVGQEWEFQVDGSDNWLIHNGKAICQGLNEAAIFQNIGDDSTVYKVEITAFLNGGSYRILNAQGGSVFLTEGQNTIYTDLLIGSLFIKPADEVNGSTFDNISVKEVIEDNSSKFTVLRDNIVSRTNSKGESEDVQIDTPVIDFIGDCPALNLGSGLNPDYITGGGSEDAINSEEGLFYVDAQALSNDLTWRQFSLSDGTTSNRVNIRYTDVSNTIAAGLWMGGSTIAEITYQLPDITKRTKIAFSYKDNEFRLWVNGAVVGEILSGTTLPVDTLNNIEFAKGDGGADPMVAYTYDLQVFNEFKEFKEIEKITGFNTFEEVANFLEYTTI